MGGQARSGPDTEAVDPAALELDAPNYAVDPWRADTFYAAIHSYWPLFGIESPGITAALSLAEQVACQLG